MEHIPKERENEWKKSAQVTWTRLWLLRRSNDYILVVEVRQKIRFLHYSRKTEQSYTHWIRRYILFHNKRHPKDMGGDEVSSFLNYLVNKENVAASTQNQALAAIVFLYKQE